MFETVDGLARDRHRRLVGRQIGIRGCRRTEQCGHSAACATDGQAGPPSRPSAKALVAFGLFRRRFASGVGGGQFAVRGPAQLQSAIGGGCSSGRLAESLEASARPWDRALRRRPPARCPSLGHHGGRILVSQQLRNAMRKIAVFLLEPGLLVQPINNPAAARWSRQFPPPTGLSSASAMATAQPALPLNLAAFNRMNATQKLAVLALRWPSRCWSARAALGEGTDLRRGVPPTSRKRMAANRRRARAAERSLPNRRRRQHPGAFAPGT